MSTFSFPLTLYPNHFKIKNLPSALTLLSIHSLYLSQLAYTIQESTLTLKLLKNQLLPLSGSTNQRDFNLLRAEKGDTCLFLNEDCHYCVNQSGQMEDGINILHELVYKGLQGLAIESNPSYIESWLLPLLVPLVSLFPIIVIVPCLFRFRRELVKQPKCQ